jgi:hypothetical protein
MRAVEYREPSGLNSLGALSSPFDRVTPPVPLSTVPISVVDHADASGGAAADASGARSLPRPSIGGQALNKLPPVVSKYPPRDSSVITARPTQGEASAVLTIGDGTAERFELAVGELVKLPSVITITAITATGGLGFAHAAPEESSAALHLVRGIAVSIGEALGLGDLQELSMASRVGRTSLVAYRNGSAVAIACRTRDAELAITGVLRTLKSAK